jgi:Asp-tRNA(Asn)/Glu-tRNA(Gln) amidotransferase A subunit family amidase
MKFLDKDGVRGMRLGVVRQLFTPQNTDPDVMKRMEQALDDLRRLGATIVDPVTIAEIDSIPPPSRPPGTAVRPPVPRRCRRVRESRPAHP